MNARNIQIIDAAMRVFSQYGYAKSTMNDIAREAGVARQTLYNAYDGKEDVLRAALRKNLETTQNQIADRWANAEDFGEKLDVFFELGPITWFDMMASSPHFAEMMEGLQKTSKEELDAFGADMVRAIADQLAPFADKITQQGQTAEALADYIFSSAANAKYNATDRDAMLQRLSVLKLSVQALLGERTR